jgi:6-phosphogluconolactonase (cycloisomerase 2 family)
MTSIRRRRSIATLLAFVVVLAGTMATTGGAAARGVDGAVYTMTNDSSGNHVVVYDRLASGELTPDGSYATGGDGSGSGLGSQGALVLSDDGTWLLAVNAGSDSVSIFRVTPAGLKLRGVTPSGGDMPISVTTHDDLVYVLNAGGAGNISGFTLHANGSLSALTGATRPLSGAGVGPAQIQFTPDGDKLVVTEKATNRIDVYLLDDAGVAGAVVVNASHGATPFGFDFAPNGTLVVSEAFGGTVDASALSSYRVMGDGTLELASGSVATTETAACWVVITPTGSYAYTTNTGSGSVSGYVIDAGGALDLLDSDGQTGLTGAGSSPIDAAIDGSGQFLYVLNGGDDSISIFRVNGDGSLSELGKVVGLAISSVGIAAR